MNFISLDLELNGESGEIIQIGMVGHPFMDLHKDILSVYVDQPNVDFNQVLSNEKTLGSYLAEDFVGKYNACKVSPEEAWRRLTEFMTRFPTKYIVQWGRGDLAALASQFELPRKHYEVVNVQNLYKHLFKPAFGKSKGTSLQAAYFSMLTSNQRLYTSEEFHDALIDAFAARDVFLKMQQLIKTTKRLQDVLDVD